MNDNIGNLTGTISTTGLTIDWANATTDVTGTATWDPSNTTIGSTSYITTANLHIGQSTYQAPIYDDIVFTDGSSVKEALKKINDRLSILEPRPEHLKNHEALRQAYEHYKIMEALLTESDPKK